MACFLVPAAEAVVTTIVTKSLELKTPEQPASTPAASVKVPFTRKLHWLSNLLWGGSALLAFEHVWHGEVTPFFPFLTAAANPADMVEMLSEMSTVGVSMAVLVTAVWGVMVGVTRSMEKRELRQPAQLR